MQYPIVVRMKSIHLPSDGAKSPKMPTKKRPWECCNDVEEASSPSGLLICGDVYWGADPGPFCTPRPWEDCCDNTICNRSLPPICQCGDEVDRAPPRARIASRWSRRRRSLLDTSALSLDLLGQVLDRVREPRLRPRRGRAPPRAAGALPCVPPSSPPWRRARKRERKSERGKSEREE
uniref:Putative Bowman Bird trypsin inhibitor n=1 Tax=Oryza sativa TaxID=4530 RepID=Q9M3W0_ORYSA|nr:putative Bowman Bird trypsin inhibitor [Oryza sativa Indica Group]